MNNDREILVSILRTNLKKIDGNTVMYYVEKQYLRSTYGNTKEFNNYNDFNLLITLLIHYLSKFKEKMLRVYSTIVYSYIK